MNNLYVHFENCFGISSLEYTFNMGSDNVYTIYARNGLMKTSFAKVFQKIQQGKPDEIQDEIFELPTTYQVDVDGGTLSPEDVFVIKSFESSYETDLTPLLINTEIRLQLRTVLTAREKLLKKLANLSGCKLKRTSGGKAVYELEDNLLADFDFPERSLLLNLQSLNDALGEVRFSGVQYATLFDPTNVKKINSSQFQEKISEFLLRSDDIYRTYGFLQKGNFTLPKLKDVKKSLEKDKFFVNENQVILSGTNNIQSVADLSAKIDEVDEAIRTDPTFKAIESLLSDAKGMQLKEILEMHPDIVEMLTPEKIPELKRTLWLTYLQEARDLFDDLFRKYNVLAAQVDSLVIDDTPWRHALDIYKKRFSVPYEMEISNLKGAIIGESIPRVQFRFTKGEHTVSMGRDRLEELDTLSQGEKRALYLLNIIFDVERIKETGRDCLFVIDDIADSFDYKNKYAIIEYLCEMAENPHFTLLILSHNFDFYRTVSSRLGLSRNERLCAELDDNGTISLCPEHYQNQPFEQWKRHPNEKNVLALIPFARNMVEFGKERNVYGGGNTGDTDYLMLTALLHQKTATNTLKFRDLCGVYREYLDINAFETDVQLDNVIINSLFSFCDGITVANKNLEYKILLSMAIRHKAEIFMKDQIASYTGTLSWGRQRQRGQGSSALFMVYVDTKGNQTRELLNGYKQFGTQESIQILEEVNIMTPENIHVNSFMYEPILDMDIAELINLYTNVKTLGR